MLVLIGDAEDWKGKPGQLISELFSVGTEIDAKAKIIGMIEGHDSSGDYAPWKENYGSLYMALSIDND